MNFKPLVASLLALGLVSAPAMAAHDAKQAKNQKHHARHHHGVRAEQRLSGNYFAQERFMNTNNAKSSVASFDWMNRFHFGGMLNVDAKYSNKAPLGLIPGFRNHRNTHELNVNNANLFVDVDVNHCVAAHVGLAYVADSVNLFDLGVNTSDDAEAYTDSIRSDKGAVWANGRLGVDEAYITIRDFAQSPLYLRAGKMYAPFGENHQVYPITESLTQLLTQTRATTAQLGWVSSYGLHASIYALDGAESSFNVSRRFNDGGDEDGARSYTKIENWGAQLGYCSAYNDIAYHLSASYIKDIRDAEYLAALQDLARFSSVPNFPRVPSFRRAGGAAFHGSATYGPFGLAANYVTAMRDLVSAQNGGPGLRGPGHHEHHTRVNAGDVTGNYGTNLWGYNTDFSLGYQRSWEAKRALLPKYRYQGDISVSVLPHTTVALEYRYDRAYANGRRGGFNGENVERRHRRGSHNSSNTTALRLGVEF